MGPQLVPVEADEHGIIPSKLRETLSRWNPATIQHPGKDGPKLLYCVPNCGNPTGASLTLERKKQIYQLAREYKFIIVEDDPYFFLKTKVGYSRNSSCTLNLISTFVLLSLGRYLCWWTISTRNIICPVVSASTPTWFIYTIILCCPCYIPKGSALCLLTLGHISAYNMDNTILLLLLL